MQSNPVISAQAIAAGVSAVVMAFLAMLVSLGVISLNPSQMDSVQTFLTAAGALAVIVVPQLLAAFWASRRTTPTADPKTKDGEPLVTVAQAQQMIAAQTEDALMQENR